MKRRIVIFFCIIGIISYQCVEPKKYDDKITINVPDQFLFVGKNKPMMTVESTKTSPTLTIINKDTTDAQIIGSDSIKVSQPGTISVQFTVENAVPVTVTKEFKVVNPNFKPIKMSIMAPVLGTDLKPTTTPPTMRKLGYRYNDVTEQFEAIHLPSDTVGYKKALDLFLQIITSSILYIEETSSTFTERVTLFGEDLLKTGTYTTEDIPQTDSTRYTFTYKETKKEKIIQAMSYKQHKTTKEITAIVRKATLIYKKQE